LQVLRFPRAFFRAMTRTRRLSVLAPAVLLTAVTVESAAAQSTPTHNDLVYAVVGGKALELDLYLPTTGKAPYPLLVFIHGGGWSGGTKDSPPGLALPLLQQGFAVASIDYRLTSEAGQYGSESVAFPAQIHDVKASLRWLRAHAWQYNLDPGRFSTWGTSAGAHLSALAALTGGVSELEGAVGGNLGWSSALQCWADYFGPSDVLFMNEDVTNPPGSNLDHDAPASPESKLVGWSGAGQGIVDIKAHLNDPTAPYPALVQLAQDASPISWVDAADPAGFLAHGANDTTVPTKQSIKLHEALQASGVEASLTVVAGAGHGALGAATELATRSFLIAHLMPQESVYLPALSTFQPKPVLGGTLTLNVAGLPGSTLWQVFRGSAASTPFQLPGIGAVLLDLGQPFAKFAQGGFPGPVPVTQSSLTLPNDPALHGTTHALQAVVLAAPLARLTNLLTVFVQ
jgi:acetyl esterase/lipase